MAEFLPALRFQALTPLFDTVLATTMRERRFKRALLSQAQIVADDAVLDLGAGTGTLAIQCKRQHPAAAVTGLDADPRILGRAREKAAAAGVEVTFVEGMSDALPFADKSFDRVLSTLFFHHLMPDVKRHTLAEVARVLRPGGRLHVADWGKPGDPAMAALFSFVRLFDGFAVTADNARGALPKLFEDAGLHEARQIGQIRTVGGTLAYYSARAGQ